MVWIPPAQVFPGAHQSSPDTLAEPLRLHDLALRCRTFRKGFLSFSTQAQGLQGTQHVGMLLYLNGSGVKVSSQKAFPDGVLLSKLTVVPSSMRVAICEF